MDIALIEPFFSGSHKTWARDLCRHCSPGIHIFSLSGQFWKWRMNAGAVFLAEKFMKEPRSFDSILGTSMLDFSLFLALTRKKTAHLPCYYYFHENQLSYPWSPQDRENQRGNSMHYILKNYTSALAADKIFFNSRYNRDSFFGGLPKFFRRFPDMNTVDTHQLYKKSHILPIAMDLSRFDAHITKKHGTSVTLLWNHRWEPDKNPEDFSALIIRLHREGYTFRVIIAGAPPRGKHPRCFQEARRILGEKIIHYGYAESFEHYAALLNQATILPVTSRQDFFGISIMEAVYCHVIPLLPERLTYPDLFDKDRNPEYFYKNMDHLYKKITDCILQKQNYKSRAATAAEYDWKKMKDIYNSFLK
ncbi:MAG: tRNA-queuosine alpha-mannosyltransferase domain-containing protein [Fibrobacterota bacterium]